MQKRDVIYVAASVLLTIAVLVFTAAADQHHYVDDDGSNSHGGTGPMDAWKTITYALEQTDGTATSERVMIHVAPGNYNITMGSGDHETFPLEPGDYDTIDGAGASDVIVDAAGAGQSVFWFVDANTEVKINGLTITNGDKGSGGGIYCLDSTLEIADCTIEYNEADYGAGIYCRRTEMTVVGCTIEHNSDAINGGGIYIYDNCSPTIEDCEINDNRAEERYGGLACVHQCSPFVVNTRIKDNSVLPSGHDKHGSGVGMDDESDPVFIGCEIIHNIEAAYGGGVFVNTGCKPQFYDCQINLNEGTHGAGMYCTGGKDVIVEDCTFDDNVSLYGGGIELRREAEASIIGCTISNNSAWNAGGGIYCEEDITDITTIEHCIISANYADNRGGGIACNMRSNPMIFNNLIVGNELGEYANGAGITCRDESSPEILNCTIADSAGEGVYAWYYSGDLTSFPTLTNCIIWNNSGPDIVNVDCSQISHCDIQDEDCGEDDGNFSGDPDFVDDPDKDYGGYHLSMNGVDGQTEDSPCRNSGDGFACVNGLHIYTTRSDDEYDSGTVDMGYHYESSRNIYWVREEGGDDSYDGRSYTYESGDTGPWKTVSHALTETPAGTAAEPIEIRVMQGDYDIDNGDMFPLDVTSYKSLIGWYGSDETTINAHQEGAERPAITVDNEAHVTIKGFTITGGYDTDGYGGGISCLASDYVTIDSCELCGNTAQFGGGVCLISGTGNEVASCAISDNIAGDYGGGIYCEDHSSPDLSHLVIKGNTAGEAGGALYCTSFSSPSLFNCLITGNAAQGGDGDGGAVCLGSDSDAEMLNCTIEGNSPSGVTASWASEPVITNCILWNNGRDLEGDSLDCSKVTCCDIEDGSCENEERNVFSEDPLFVPRDPEDPENEYTGYYLAQIDAQAGDSPCLNEGDDQASAYGLDTYTTCTDGSYDEGLVDIGYHHTEAYDGSDDTYIELTSLEAKAKGRNILIAWETGTEIDNAGFNLYRVNAGARTTPEKINDRLIPAKGSPAAGASYEFLDTNVRPGGAYSYYLVDIETDGTTTRHGPVSARVSIRPIVIPDERMRPGVNRPEILRVMSYMPRFWPLL